MPDKEQLRDHIHELQTKLDTSLLTLAFSALALSIYFSPKMGMHGPLLLMLSWVLLFASGCMGGWRLLYTPVALRWNLKAVLSHENPIEAMEAKGKFSELNDKMPKVLNWQVWTLVIGLFAGVLFSAVNYLHSNRHVSGAGDSQPEETSSGGWR